VHEKYSHSFHRGNDAVSPFISVGFIRYRIISWTDRDEYPQKMDGFVYNDTTYFAIMGFNNERGTAEMVHDLCHRAEAAMSRVLHCSRHQPGRIILESDIKKAGKIKKETCRYTFVQRQVFIFKRLDFSTFHISAFQRLKLYRLLHQSLTVKIRNDDVLACAKLVRGHLDGLVFEPFSLFSCAKLTGHVVDQYLELIFRCS
jgi:hypothetical protein